MRNTEAEEKKNFRIWVISAAPAMAGRGGEPTFGLLLSGCCENMDCRISNGMAFATPIRLYC